MRCRDGYGHPLGQHDPGWRQPHRATQPDRLRPVGPGPGLGLRQRPSLARSHDLDYRPSTVYDSATGGLSLHYGYDAAGQLTQLKDGLQSAFLARYDYDNLGRLTVLRDGPSNTPIETYDYDATGNRTSLLHSGVTTSFTYPSTSHRLSSAGGVARTYDGVGNTLTIGGTAKQFNYGEDDRMRSLQVGGTVVRGYAYNALGERVLSTVPGITGNPDGSGGTPDVHTYTVYDESGRWLGDYGTNGAVLQQAIWLDDLPVGLLAGAGAQQKLHYIEPDHLGTPRAVIDRTRDVAIWTWALQGEAFGNSPPNQDPDLDSTNFVFDMRFPGQRYDAATGLNYNYFRDYEPSSGRYVQSDPIGLRGGISSYQYATGSPLSFIDPLGLEALAPLAVGGNGDRQNITRKQLEGMMAVGKLSPDVSRNLDRGCIGLAAAYQGKGAVFPELAPNTNCYTTQDQAMSAAKCKKPFIFAKQGYWRRGVPTPGPDGRVPNDSVMGKNGTGYYNYITYFPSTATYVWMDHGKEFGPQNASLDSYPVNDPKYPKTIWCNTCP